MSETIAPDVQPADVETNPEPTPGPTIEKRRRGWRRPAFTMVLPFLLLLLAAGAGYLRYETAMLNQIEEARAEAVRAATDGAIAMLSYGSQDAQTTLTAARDRLTGPFLDSYTSLINDVVIPGAAEQDISVTATVPGAAAVSTDTRHAVVMVFVNQAISMGTEAPTNTTSSVEVTLDKRDGRWLISGFEPR